MEVLPNSVVDHAEFCLHTTEGEYYAQNALLALIKHTQTNENIHLQLKKMP